MILIVNCLVCGKPRKIAIQQMTRKKYTGLCADCSRRSRAGANSPSWVGGRVLHYPYWHVYKPDHPYTTKKGYVLEQRLVAEEKLGRYLLPSEVVHHINGDTFDNRSENIFVFSSQKEHCAHHKFGGVGGGCRA